MQWVIGRKHEREGDAARRVVDVVAVIEVETVLTEALPVVRGEYDDGARKPRAHRADEPADLLVRHLGVYGQRRKRLELSGLLPLRR